MSVLVFSIDGPDYCGKSSVAKVVAEKLKEKYKNVHHFDLPSSSLLTGLLIRVFLKSREKIDQKVLSLMFAADHLNYYEKMIKPLEESKERHIVIQERGLITTYIYQGIIGKVPFEWLDKINKYCKTKTTIDFILKVKHEVLLERAKKAVRERSVFDLDDFLKKSARAYNDAEEKLKKRFNIVVVDGEKEINKVAEEIVKKIEGVVD